jgi:hypothetical protein
MTSSSVLGHQWFADSSESVKKGAKENNERGGPLAGATIPSKEWRAGETLS